MNKMINFLYVACLVFFVSCTQTNQNTTSNNGLADKAEILTDQGQHVKDNTNGDKTIHFLRRDDNNSIVIDTAFCQTISAPEKAALGYVATFVGNECEWDGAYTADRSNLKCQILTALDLGYQCSDKHLGFLRELFKKDTSALKELESCPTTPNTATIQDTFDEITLTTQGNKITVSFRATALNLREESTVTWSETDEFLLENDGIKLIKKSKSDVNKRIRSLAK